MYADVAPLLRLPPNLGVFTYDVPPSLASSVRRGVFVRVPFRRRRVWGVVLRVHDRVPDQYATRPIADVVRTCVLSDAEIAVVEITASLHRTSVATVATLALPSPVRENPERGVGSAGRTGFVSAHQSSPPWVSSALGEAGDAVVVFHSHQQRLQAIAAIADILTREGRSVLVVTPHYAWFSRMVDAIVSAIPSPGCTIPVVVLEPSRGARARWAAALTARQRGVMILTTRSGSFVAPETLGAIVVDGAESDDLKQENTDPRFDARTVTRMTAAALGVPRILLSAAPRLEEWKAARVRIDLGRSPVTQTIVDLRAHWRSGATGYVTQELAHAVETAIATRRVALILHNRIGRATRIACRSCHAFATCPTCGHPLVERESGACCLRCAQPITCERCTKCGSPFLVGRGAGTVGIADQVRRAFPGAVVMRVDGTTPDAPPTDAQVVVASDRFPLSIAPLFRQPVGVLAIACVERLVRGDDFRGRERLLQALRSTAVWARTWGCPLIMQTMEPTDPLLRAVDGDLAACYREELAERSALEFPPATRLVRCEASGSVSDDAITAMRSLPTRFPHGTLVNVDGPFPSTRRGKAKTSFLLRFRGDARDDDVANVVRDIPTMWTIDVDPTSIHA